MENSILCIILFLFIWVLSGCDSEEELVEVDVKSVQVFGFNNENENDNGVNLALLVRNNFKLPIVIYSYDYYDYMYKDHLKNINLNGGFVFRFKSGDTTVSINLYGLNKSKNKVMINPEESKRVLLRSEQDFFSTQHYKTKGDFIKNFLPNATLYYCFKDSSNKNCFEITDKNYNVLWGIPDED